MLVFTIVHTIYANILSPVFINIFRLILFGNKINETSLQELIVNYKNAHLYSFL